MFSKVTLREIVYVLAALISMGATYGKIQTDLDQIKRSQQTNLENQEKVIREITELWKEVIKVKTRQEDQDDRRRQDQTIH